MQTTPTQPPRPITRRSRLNSPVWLGKRTATAAAAAEPTTPQQQPLFAFQTPAQPAPVRRKQVTIGNDPVSGAPIRRRRRMATGEPSKPSKNYAVFEVFAPEPSPQIPNPAHANPQTAATAPAFSTPYQLDTESFFVYDAQRVRPVRTWASLGVQMYTGARRIGLVVPTTRPLPLAADEVMPPLAPPTHGGDAAAGVRQVFYRHCVTCGQLLDQMSSGKATVATQVEDFDFLSPPPQASPTTYHHHQQNRLTSPPTPDPWVVPSSVSSQIEEELPPPRLPPTSDWATTHEDIEFYGDEQPTTTATTDPTEGERWLMQQIENMTTRPPTPSERIDLSRLLSPPRRRRRYSQDDADADDYDDDDDDADDNDDENNPHHRWYHNHGGIDTTAGHADALNSSFTN